MKSTRLKKSVSLLVFEFVLLGGSTNPVFSSGLRDFIPQIVKHLDVEFDRYSYYVDCLKVSRCHYHLFIATRCRGRFPVLSSELKKQIQTDLACLWGSPVEFKGVVNVR